MHLANIGRADGHFLPTAVGGIMPCPCHRCFHLIDREARVKLAHIAVIILSLLSSISSLPLSKVATLSSIFFFSALCGAVSSRIKQPSGLSSRV